jgi:plastocyanin
VRYAAPVLIAGSGLMAGVAILAAPKQHTHTVTIEAVQFAPARLTVHPGERIVWVNKDPFPHTVTAANRAFDSGSIAANASWTFVPSKPGEYPYRCTFHPNMQGQITVQ